MVVFLGGFVGLIVVVSVLPAVIHVWQDPEHREEILRPLRRLFGRDVPRG